MPWLFAAVALAMIFVCDSFCNLPHHAFPPVLAAELPLALITNTDRGLT
jgi:hypothetical protein